MMGHLLPRLSPTPLAAELVGESWVFLRVLKVEKQAMVIWTLNVP